MKIKSKLLSGNSNRQLGALVKRSVTLYFRDPLSVFLSLLGAIIALLIVIFFLKDSIVDGMVQDYVGLVERAEAERILNLWLVASAAVICSGTTGLGAMRQYIADRETRRWRDFLVSPVSPWILTASYILSATIVSLVMTTFVFIVGTIWCAASGATLSASGVLISWGWIVLCCFSFTALMGFLASFLKTMSAFTGLSTVVGVLFGFLSQTYVTTSSLPSGVVNVLNVLPFAQGTALVRDAYTEKAIEGLPEVVRDTTRESMGITLKLDGTIIENWVIVAVLVSMIAVFFILAWRVIARNIRRS